MFQIHTGGLDGVCLSVNVLYNVWSSGALSAVKCMAVMHRLGIGMLEVGAIILMPKAIVCKRGHPLVGRCITDCCLATPPPRAYGIYISLRVLYKHHDEVEDDEDGAIVLRNLDRFDNAADTFGHASLPGSLAWVGSKPRPIALMFWLQLYRIYM